MSSQKTGCVYFLMSSILTFSFSFSFIIFFFFGLVADFITKWIIVAIDLLVRFYTRNLLLFSLRMLLLRLLLLSQILYPLTRLLYFIVASYVSIGYHYVNVFAIVFIPTTVIPVVIDIIFVHLSIGFFLVCVSRCFHFCRYTCNYYQKLYLNAMVRFIYFLVSLRWKQIFPCL